MKLNWSGVFKKGSPADLMLLNSKSWAETLATPPDRRVMVGGEWIKEEALV